MPIDEFENISLKGTIKIHKPEKGDLGLPQIPDREDVHEPSDQDNRITTNYRRPLVSTSELPPIPEELIARDVNKRAQLVISDLIGDGESEDFMVEQDKEREVSLRRRIVIQLEKVVEFLSKLRKVHCNSVPSFNDQFAIHYRTIAANIGSLENENIKTRDVIANMSKFVTPQLIELQRQFKSDEDENFSFDEVRDQIMECLEILANMENSKL